MEWQGNGMGAAWAWHAMCESAFNSFNKVYSYIVYIDKIK